jgi:penicillin amidase
MKPVAKFALAVLSIVVAAVGGGIWWLFTSLPPLEGTLRLPGLKAPVTVARDSLGIPRIVGEHADDAYFALGFTHAQDRLWQMEAQRRLGAGRLAEILGEKALPTDKFMRTLGLYGLAEQSFARLQPEVQSALTAYATGVNAYLDHRQVPLPVEFQLLGLTPESWKPADSLVWGYLMALQLSGNWRDELLRAKLSAYLPADQVADLWGATPGGGPTTVGLSEPFIEHMLAAIPPALMPQQASNVWVVSGDRSITGKPILANDPHLGFQVPIIWYLAVLSTPDVEVAGATIPGVPFHILGHNRRIAWGMTTTQSDCMDLFVEKPAGDGYLTPDGPRPFVQRNEVIEVRGGEPVTITVRETRHGPVISDVLGERAEGRLLALAASALDPDNLTPQAVYHINRAADWTEFTEALRDFGAPQQNFAYADIDGHIGLISPGRVPIRKSGDGTLPSPGWTGDNDWVAWIPFDHLPRVFDPPSGVIVNANNKLVPDSYPYLLAAVWPASFRAQRIIERLDESPRLGIEDMSILQMDELSLMAADLKPRLLKVPPRGAHAAAVYGMLKEWDNVMSANAAEPLIFSTWLTRLQNDLLRPWLGSDAQSFGDINPHFLKAVLDGRTVWCNGRNLPPPKTCADKVADALDAALDAIAGRFGDNMADWHWGDAHQAVFEPLLLRYIPGLKQATSLIARTGGDDFTVQRGSFSETAPAVFRHVHGAGLRAVYDLSDLSDSRFIIATGQSGNPLSRHWGDMLDAWRIGGSVPLDASRPALQVEILEPEDPSRTSDNR